MFWKASNPHAKFVENSIDMVFPHFDKATIDTHSFFFSQATSTGKQLTYIYINTSNILPPSTYSLC